MTEVPSELMEFIEERPLICPNCFSSGAVTSEAITSGSAPGYWEVTWIVGKSTVGSAETGRNL